MTAQMVQTAGEEIKLNDSESVLLVGTKVYYRSLAANGWNKWAEVKDSISLYNLNKRVENKKQHDLLWSPILKAELSGDTAEADRLYKETFFSSTISGGK